jgi:hypothetical protein
LLPSGPGGVCSHPLHEARSLTNYKFITTWFRGYSKSMEVHFPPELDAKLPPSRDEF